MMNRLQHTIICLLLLLLPCSCLKEWGSNSIVNNEQPVDVVLKFGAADLFHMDVTTKSSMGLEPESMVYNLYVFIFDKNGEKFYSQYFDYTNLNVNTESNWWEVKNNYKATNNATPVTYGYIHLHTEAKENCKVVVIANIDAEMVNISPEQLGMVSTYDDLKNKKATLNQLIVARSGYFPMSGEMSIDNTSNAEWGVLTLRRLDAKIKFNVYAKAGSKIASFSPLKWQVVNIPKRAYILERGHYGDAQASLEDATGETDADYFSLGETNFETETVTENYYSGSDINKIMKHGFSFYMMENRKAPQLTPATYADRDHQSKDNPVTVGSFTTVENGAFTHAPLKGTYVIITGHVNMDNITYGASEDATLSADVRYMIHLGDFSTATGSLADFNVFRNHTYVYDIIIEDVENIKVEVSCNNDDEVANNLNEPEPGATGVVSVALEEIYTSDAHYSSHVITFHAKNIDAENVSWVVETPFNPTGASPRIVEGSEGAEITTGIDFEWVEFRRNNRSSDNNQYFEDKRQIYLPRGMEREEGESPTWNISELVDYLRKQKKLYNQNPALSDFDASPDSEGGPKICVTAFVNEYYYEVNPITGEYDKDLWKSFVNQPMRYMHILSETKMSADGESKIIGSSFTIQQKSIQSIYNISNPDLQSAWGCEHTADQLETGKNKTYSPTTNGNRRNNSQSNGRYNTLVEWGLIDGINKNNDKLGKITAEDAWWEYYMDLEVNNETPMMWDKGQKHFQYLRYSCMTRNRDNNGNGVIDKDEVRWYMGATNQLIGLFLGGYGIEGAARLYQRNAQEQASTVTNVWREHVISSTKYGNNSDTEPRVIWAEEGLNGSNPEGSRKYSHLDEYTTRCVRNLGYDPNTDADITFSDYDVEPDNYLTYRRLKDGVEYNGAYDDNVYYEFDCSRLNKASLRYYTNRELILHDELSESACLYTKFMVNPAKDSPEIKSNNTINAMNEYLNKNIGVNPFCPPGYRLCNVREAAVIWYFIPDNNYRRDYNFTRTYWSFGVYSPTYNSARQDTGTSWGWGTAKAKTIMANKDNQKTSYIRCVRDIKVE